MRSQLQCLAFAIALYFASCADEKTLFEVAYDSVTDLLGGAPAIAPVNLVESNSTFKLFSRFRAEPHPAVKPLQEEFRATTSMNAKFR